MHDTQVTTIDELVRENLVGVQVAGVELVVVFNAGGISVFQGHCPHQGTLLSEGQIEDGRLVCRGHGWQFNSASGTKVDDDLICLHRFSVVVDRGKVLVDRTEIEAWAEEHEKGAVSESKRPLLNPEQLPGPRGIPVLGNMHQIETKKFHLILEDWHQKHGDIYQFKLGPEHAVAIADPEMVQSILVDRPDGFSRSSGITQTIEEMGIEGLFSAEGEQWRRHRHLAKGAFDVRHLREFFPTMAKVTRRLHSRWHQFAAQQTPLNAQKELMRFTVDITTNLAFGYDMNTLEDGGDHIQGHIERVFTMIASRAFMPVRYWNYIKFPADRALEASLAELKVTVDQFIDNTRQQMDENQALWVRPQNLLQALLAAQADEDIELSDREIYGNVFTFLLAGEDTTANSIAWMLYYMAKYPEVQRKMQAEADAVLMDSVSVTEYEQIRDLRYIEAVAHETMRFKPVATFLALQALKDVTVNHLQIPEGTPVFLLLRPKGLEDTEFAGAAEFNPERWIDYSRHENPHHRKSFLPFGGGPRLCPGRSLALHEIKMAVSMICRNFDVARTEPDGRIDERFIFTMMPLDLLISLHHRNN